MTNNEPLPPKTCEIDRMITKPEDIKKVLQGKKTATRRNGRYADPGEIMHLEGKSFRVERVYRQTLGDLTDEIANQEGYENLEAYKQSILSIHPGMPWKDDMKVWAHDFSAVEDEA
ncbi:hypothetical protein CR194_05850 [Salipaludibacillus keqinensis]|uniref:ASCH domain-containing protein n=1 Tax=Salipaludibacillus keqinensis TaxID=2045207 RepID=A0A323TLQ4_9BACI|nr:ASCH domain-containing protein [Salipaludibacillus keqinensis]PYZ95036.1 hypothetical protein CR194_05850 [Salipaludibacillus keqinensis]